MALLRDALGKTSFYGVTTYIQSGNIIFNSDLLKSDFDMDIPVIVKKQSQFKEILQVNPFKTRTMDDAKFMSFGFLSEIPEQDKVEEVMSFSTELETFKIVNNVIYFYCGVGFGKTKMTNAWFEKKLDVVSTMRNYNTTLKLTEL
ncbi:hypothetical protein JCM19298_841 [Nonlabens ulvanivorans]|nr:hypothetical protein JCM19298_841 [Nonlabens ulvanivorans]